MGADAFRVVGKGKSAELAFRSVVKAARYEHGHGGYTGTIAEKERFEMIDVDVEANRLIDELKKRKAACTVKGQRELAREIEWAGRMNNWSRQDRLRERRVYVLPNETMADACKRTRARISDDIKSLTGKRSRPEAVAEMIDIERFDKWGPCGCIRIKAGEFCFVGLASS